MKQAREKKEAAKRRELNKKRINELTQGAAQSRERKKKELEAFEPRRAKRRGKLEWQRPKVLLHRS